MVFQNVSIFIFSFIVDFSKNRKDVSFPNIGKGGVPEDRLQKIQSWKNFEGVGRKIEMNILFCVIVLERST